MRHSLLLSLLLLLTPLLSAEEEEFTALFNGRNLDGWVLVNSAPSTWTVREGGLLHCSGKPTGELRTTRQYQNFILEVDWRHLVPGGNSGIFVWAEDIPARGVPFHRAVEVQVLDNAYGEADWFTTHGDVFPIHGAVMRPENGRGGMRAFPTELRSHPSPQWNHYRITCVDGSITLEVNGKAVTHGHDASPRRGYICLESEGGEVDFKNLRIRELPSTPVAPGEGVAPARGFETLYDGLSLEGWRVQGEWQPQDWRLVHTGEEPGAITTQARFADHAFVLDFLRKGKGPVRLLLRGDEKAAVDLDPEGNWGEGWHRLEGRLRGPFLTLRLDGKELVGHAKLDPPPAPSGPLRIKCAAAIELANLFARPLGPDMGPALVELPLVHPDEAIGFTLYTLSRRTLKLTAQLYPLAPDAPRECRLERWEGERWREIARAPVIEPGWTATFRVEDWDDSVAWPYRVRHGERAAALGTVRANPIDRDELVLCAFTGNSIYPGHGGDIDRGDLVANVQRLDADLLFFSGDQVYDHNRHLAAWLRFGRDFGEVLRDRPTITIPDDHDVGQSNLWGQGAEKRASTPAGPDGGYYKSPAYVREVERAQTSHLPDPFAPTTLPLGIGTYYTILDWGGISFAILEDRKFKSGPEGLVPPLGPRPDHITDPDFDVSRLDVPGARLLGEAQLAFLDYWARHWNGEVMKVALSQTIFCGGAHIHGKVGGRIVADLDSNGWPQSGRNRALAALRRAHAFHIAGDQHLATVFHHGIEAFDDAIWSFCVPSIANLYLRWWKPLEPGEGLRGARSPLLGRHYDGLGNRVTAWAVANPSEEPAGGDALTTRAAGFGVVRFHKGRRSATFECWPRGVDLSDPSARMYPLWPIEVRVEDNDGRKPAGWIEIATLGREDCVVQLIDEETGELISAIRPRGNHYRAPVFDAAGRYTLRVDDLEFKHLACGEQVLADFTGRH